MDTQVIIQALPEIFTQLLAFLIAFWVLKKFAFKPILQVIDARRKKIEGTFADLDKKQLSLEALEKDYRQRLDRIEEEARVKIQEAAGLGTVLARDIQEKARQDAQKMIERARAEIEQDLAQARLSMRDQLVELSSLMTEKILEEKISPQEHERLVDKFIKELEKI